MERIKRFFKEEEGILSAIEYGLIAALIAVVIIGVVGVIGTQLNVKFKRLRILSRFSKDLVGPLNEAKHGCTITISHAWLAIRGTI